MSILDVWKRLMYKFWYDYISPKYGYKAKLCYTDTDSFIIYIKTEDISNDIERGFDTSNYDKNEKPLPIGKNKKVPGLFKVELVRKIIKEFVAFRAKPHSHLDDDGNKYKKSKGTKKCAIKQKLMFQNFKDCLLNNKIVYKS